MTEPAREVPDLWIRQVAEEIQRRIPLPPGAGGSPTSGATTSGASAGSAPGSPAAAGPGSPPAAPGAALESCACTTHGGALGPTGASANLATGPHCADCPEPGFCTRNCPDRIQLLLEHGVERVGCSLGVGPVDRTLASMLDHTLLRPEATARDIAQLCEEAHCYGFATVCVQPLWVPAAARVLEGSRVKVCTVIGFPHGANRAEVKAYETQVAVAQRAREVDMVIPIGALKGGEERTVAEHVRAVVRAAVPGIVTKVILETAFLTDEEKRIACRIARDEGASFVKTSTGFGPSGANLEDVRLMREVVGPAMGVKAAGGIRSTETARRMVEAGATRIGASASIKIAGGS
jgi:deoxyribose-phosphate aldolase